MQSSSLSHQFQADDGSHHMFAAVMANNGSLATWLSQSVVGHAVSKTGPQGW
jgi:hypothetical protein